MPQNPLAATIAVTPSNAQAPARLDGQNALRTTPAPTLTRLGISAATVVKAAPGRIARVNVIAAGTTAGGVYDCLTTQAAATSNQIASIPTLSTAAIGVLTVEAAALVGITILPGTGQTLAAIYE